MVVQKASNYNNFGTQKIDNPKLARKNIVIRLALV